MMLNKPLYLQVGVKFVGSSNPPPTILTYEFGGFTDNTVYYIKGFGSTINGTSIETPLTSITVKYIQPNIFAIVELSQNCTGGYVTVKSNMANIEGTSNPTPPTYIDDEAVDLTQEGSWVNINSVVASNAGALFNTGLVSIYSPPYKI